MQVYVVRVRRFGCRTKLPIFDKYVSINKWFLLRKGYEIIKFKMTDFSFVCSGSNFIMLFFEFGK